MPQAAGGDAQRRCRRCGTIRRLLAAVAILCVLVGGDATAGETLPVVARVGPWPEISKLVGFGDRLWFANSVKGRNHNSADLYSYDPGSGRLRYERHLFTQDVGGPAAAGGLLYWPFEDSRLALGWGGFAVTDGTRWRVGTIPSARIYHTHALAQTGGRLVAATSAWRAGLQVSENGGVTWREVYDRPTPKGRVSRIVELETLGGRIFAHLTERQGDRLLVFDAAGVRDTPGWPQGHAILGLAARGDWLYGLVREPQGTSLWRSDGRRSERVSGLPWTSSPRGFAAGAGGLWTVTDDETDATLWRSDDGTDWRAYRRLEGGKPREITVYAGRVYVAGAGDDGRGLLWGPPPPAPVERAPITAELTSLPAPPSEPIDWNAEAQRLDRLLAAPANYAHHGAVLRDRIYEAARVRPPAGFFSARLFRPFPDGTVSIIGGRLQVPLVKMGRWLLIWGMAVAGEGRVPPAFVAAPWEGPSNEAEKYFETPAIALWAVAALGQDDRETVAALITRLDRPGDPPWLLGDVVGALAAVTGRRFGYDVAAWRGWWQAAGSSW